MGMLTRYKKRGFQQLLILLETTPEDKKVKLLKLIAEENPAWEEALKSKMLTMQALLTWPEKAWNLILKDAHSLHLSMLTGSLNDEEKTKFMEILPIRMRTQVMAHLEVKKPTAAEAWTATSRLYSDVRRLLGDGSLRLSELSPELVIPEGIEDQLATGVLLLLNSKPVLENAPSIEPQPQQDVSETTITGFSVDIDEVKKRFKQIYQENQKLYQENQRLMAEVHELKARMIQIKKIA